MSRRDDLTAYARFAWGLQRFFRQRFTLDEAKAIIRQRLEQREERLLRVVRRGIFEYPRSPYLALLRWAGCAYGDLERLVRQQGVEGALVALRDAGVYVEFEELKGRRPLTRPGLELALQARDFDNPYLGRYYYQAESGGSTGAGTRMTIDLDDLTAAAPYMMVAYATHGLLGAPTLLWRSGLPDSSSFTVLLRDSLFGQTPRKWFTPISGAHMRPRLRDRVATWYTVAVGRAVGVPLPWPEPLPLDLAVVAARWAARAVTRHGACHVRCGVSLMLRIALAAQETGLDLRGVTFVGGSEPVTAAKARLILASGARLAPTYAMVEAGPLGFGCPNPLDVSDVHLREDTVALITRRRPAPHSNGEVETFLLTTLQPTTPKLLLNVDVDDYGIVERRACGCLLEQVGYGRHLREIRSVSKLTGEGVTLVGSDLETVLEEELPRRFGGSPLDYQLVEEESARGFTRVVLRVSPRVGPLDDTAALEVLRAALRRSNGAAHLAEAYWSQAGTLLVRREEPVATARAKLLPLQSARPRGAEAPPRRR